MSKGSKPGKVRRRESISKLEKTKTGKLTPFAQYCVISHRWNQGFVVEQPATGEDPNLFWEGRSKMYSSVMFQSFDRGGNWFVCKYQGYGAINKIMDAREVHLPKRQDVEKMEEVQQWLLSLGLEHYAEKFETKRYESFSNIRQLSLTQLDEMIRNVGLNCAEASKIRESLFEINDEQSKIRESSLFEINNEQSKIRESSRHESVHSISTKTKSMGIDHSKLKGNERLEFIESQIKSIDPESKSNFLPTTSSNKQNLQHPFRPKIKHNRRKSSRLRFHLSKWKCVLCAELNENERLTCWNCKKNKPAIEEASLLTTMIQTTSQPPQKNITTKVTAKETTESNETPAFVYGDEVISKVDGVECKAKVINVTNFGIVVEYIGMGANQYYHQSIDTVRKVKKMQKPRYCVLSNVWGKINMKELATEEDPEIYMKSLSPLYSSVMFISKDQGEHWDEYRTKGTGKINQIIATQDDYLPKMKTEKDLISETDKTKRIIFKPGNIGISISGNCVTEIVPKGQGDQYGVQCGWRILEINGKQQTNDQDVIDTAIAKTYKLGISTEILFGKDNVDLQRLITVKQGILGLDCEGNKVSKVHDGSQAKQLGIKNGWEILEINGVKCDEDNDEMNQKLKFAKKGKLKYTILFAMTKSKDDAEILSDETDNNGKVLIIKGKLKGCIGVLLTDKNGEPKRNKKGFYGVMLKTKNGKTKGIWKPISSFQTVKNGSINSTKYSNQTSIFPRNMKLLYSILPLIVDALNIPWWVGSNGVKGLTKIFSAVLKNISYGLISVIIDYCKVKPQSLEMTQYCMISDLWGAITVKELSREDAEMCMENISSEFYSVVMFKSQNYGAHWTVHKTKGKNQGIQKIIESKDTYLPSKVQSLLDVISSKSEVHYKSPRLYDADADALGYLLSVNTTLTELVLISVKMTNLGMHRLTDGLKRNSTLLVLVLGTKRHGNNIGPTGASFFATALKLNSSLTQFRIPNNNIGDDGAKQIAASLKINSGLEMVHLGGNKIGDDGAFAIGEALKMNSTLRFLILERNNITDSGAKFLTQGLLLNSTVTFFSLYENMLTDKSSVDLHTLMVQNKSLTELSFARNYFSETIVHQLRIIKSMNSSIIKFAIETDWEK